MPIIKLQETNTGKALYAGLYADLKECLEHAVEKNIDLTGINLSYTNLSNANLDGARMAKACFYNANLSGANLSEATLDSADFRNASLYNTCLCESSLKNCNFEDACFGATDIDSSALCYSRFSTYSAFTLPFRRAENMQGCVYRSIHGQTIQMSAPPIVIEGLSIPLVITDHHVIANGNIFPLNLIFSKNKSDLSDKIDNAVTEFVIHHKQLLSLLIKKTEDQAMHITAAAKNPAPVGVENLSTIT